MKILVREFYVECGVLEFMAHTASSYHIPVQNADFTFLLVVFAIGYEWHLCVYINYEVG